MKSKYITILASILALTAWADITVSQDRSTGGGSNTITFLKPNTTLTITGNWDGLWNSPRVNFGDNYVYTEGDKVTVNITSNGSVSVEGASNGSKLFGIDSQSPSKCDVYITGAGYLSSNKSKIETFNSNQNLFLDVNTNFVNTTYYIGSDANGGSLTNTNLTITNTVELNNFILQEGSTLKLASDSDSSAELYMTGKKDNVEYHSQIKGTLIQTGGIYQNYGRTQVYGTLDLSVEKGFMSNRLDLHNGSTVIIKANNAIMENETNILSTYNITGAKNTLKLYADQEFGYLRYGSNGAVVDAYTNGFDLTFNAIAFAQDGYTGTLNIFIEDGYEWTNETIRFLTATVEQVESILGSITINGTAIDKSNWDIVSDGANGVFVNVAVPEPAEWAAIFGAIALGFVAYRRRK